MNNRILNQDKEKEFLEIQKSLMDKIVCEDRLKDEDEQQRIYDFMESISINVEIDENGIVTED